MSDDDKLTRFLAEKVLGWRWCEETNDWITKREISCDRYEHRTLDITDMNDAMKLLEKCSDVELRRVGDAWGCFVDCETSLCEWHLADTPQRAICLAVAAAHGWTE